MCKTGIRLSDAKNIFSFWRMFGSFWCTVRSICGPTALHPQDMDSPGHWSQPLHGPCSRAPALSQILASVLPWPMSESIPEWKALYKQEEVEVARPIRFSLFELDREVWKEGPGNFRRRCWNEGAKSGHGRHEGAGSLSQQSCKKKEAL